MASDWREELSHTYAILFTIESRQNREIPCCTNVTLPDYLLGAFLKGKGASLPLQSWSVFRPRLGVLARSVAVKKNPITNRLPTTEWYRLVWAGVISVDSRATAQCRWTFQWPIRHEIVVLEFQPFPVPATLPTCTIGSSCCLWRCWVSLSTSSTSNTQTQRSCRVSCCCISARFANVSPRRSSLCFFLIPLGNSRWPLVDPLSCRLVYG